MKKSCIPLILLVAVLLMVAPVSADEVNTTNTTAAPTTLETTVASNVTTLATTVTTTAAATTTATTAAVTTTTVAPTTTTVTTVPSTTATTPATTVTTSPTTMAATGSASVASTPLGAAILIDGVYYGTTPGNVTGLSPGNHILRLALSGYTDYEGSLYVLAGENMPAFGTLHPLSSSSQIIVATATTPVATAVPDTTVQPAATNASSEGPFESPTVVAALIGIVTACIGAGATIFTHNAKVRKEEKNERNEKP